MRACDNVGEPTELKITAHFFTCRFVVLLAVTAITLGHSGINTSETDRHQNQQWLTSSRPSSTWDFSPECCIAAKNISSQTSVTT